MPETEVTAEMSETEPPWSRSRPTFELVAMSSEPDLPGPIAERLRTPGVPNGLIGHEYRALEAATLLRVASADGGVLVAFGSSGFDQLICLDISSGAVVQVPRTRPESRNAVNASLDLFSACVHAVIGRFPFYGVEAESDDRERIGEELGQVLAAIDRSALEHNGFWETFVDDVVIGDYSTEEVAGGA